MFRATKSITFIHREPAETMASGDSYTCIHSTGSWYEKNKATVTEAGLKTARTVKCRIPCTSPGTLAQLRRGDKMALGTLTQVDGHAFAALGRTNGAVTILDIHDNTDAANGHFYIEGAD